MDKLIYLAAQAAKGTMSRQENIANNLANVSTPGFRSQLMAFRSAPVVGEGAGSRSYAVETTVGFDSTSGQLQATGRDLDVAIQGEGWFAINGPDGNEAYTRAGSFLLDQAGQLVNSNGLPVIGTNGPINAPPDHKLTFEGDGSITATPLTGAGGPIALGKLKLVNPPKDQIVRSDDGLFRMKDGQIADPDNTLKVASGFIETSNVNAVEMMVQMITAARQFETQMKMISTEKENGQAANNLFGMN